MSGSGAARAADQVRYGPPEPWVQAASISTAESAPDSGAVQVLLQDNQTRFGPDGDVFYTEQAIRLAAPQALNVGNLIWTWNPDNETLTVHKLRVIRDGQVIDLLAKGKTLTVLRRETNLEAAALDGELTGTIQPDDLRVGDIIDFATSLRRSDPVRRGFSEGFVALDHSGVAGHIRIRALWDAAKPMRWAVTAGMDQPTVSLKGGQTEAVIDRIKVAAPTRPAGAPPRYQHVGELEFSQFHDWAELSGIMSPLYEKAATLAPNSQAKAAAAKINAEKSDLKDRAFAALKLVEDQTRYVFLGMNQGGWVPAEADLTWSRRFGDCKGKTALLLALLHELGVEAEPVFVSTTDGDGLDHRLPMLNLFDHVLVRAQIEGKAYWLDGTRMGDRSLDDIPTPAFHWALPLRATGAQLIPIVQPAYTQPQSETLVRLQVRAGLETPAEVRVERLYRGDQGVGSKLVLSAVNKAEIDRYLREYWSREYPWVQAGAVGWDYSADTGVTRVWVDGRGALNWIRKGSFRGFEVIDSSLGGDPDFHREDGPNKDAPFAVDFPNYEKWTVRVTLPQKGVGMSLENPGDLDTIIAGVAYKRTARMADGVVVVQTETRSVAADFPAAETQQAAVALRRLSYQNVFIRALAPSSVATEAPQDAAKSGEISQAGVKVVNTSELVARAARAMSAGDYVAAIKNFSQAIKIEPKSAKYLYDRGVAYYQNGDDNLALADFDASLELSPSDSLALAARAELELFHAQLSEARRDFDRALKTASDRKGFLRRLADAYHDAGYYAEAIGYYEDWLRIFAGDATEDDVKAQLCLSRAKAGRDPDATLEQCSGLAKEKPRLAAAREGQALSLLRQSHSTEAVAVFQAMLDADHEAEDALYGRGLARVRAGDAAGLTDIKAATAKDSGVAARFKSYGLAP